MELSRPFFKKYFICLFLGCFHTRRSCHEDRSHGSQSSGKADQLTFGRGAVAQSVEPPSKGPSLVQLYRGFETRRGIGGKINPSRTIWQRTECSEIWI